MAIAPLPRIPTNPNGVTAMCRAFILSALCSLPLLAQSGLACCVDFDFFAPPLGIDEGMTLTFRETDDSGTRDIVWSARRLAEPVAIWDETMRESGDTTVSDGLVLFEGDEPRWLIRSAAGEIRIYDHLWDDEYALDHAIPLAVADGSTWTSKRLVMGCGFLVTDVSWVAARETLTVPAGEFDSFRLESSSLPRGDATIWLSASGDLLKFTRHGKTYELVSRQA